MKKVFSLLSLVVSVAVCAQAVGVHEEMGPEPVEAEADVWAPVAPEPAEESTVSTNTQQAAVTTEAPEDVEPVLE